MMAHPFAPNPVTSPAGANTPNPDSPGSLAGGDLLDAPGIFPTADAAPLDECGPRGRGKLPSLARPRDNTRAEMGNSPGWDDPPSRNPFPYLVQDFEDGTLARITRPERRLQPGTGIIGLIIASVLFWIVVIGWVLA